MIKQPFRGIDFSTWAKQEALEETSDPYILADREAIKRLSPELRAERNKAIADLALVGEIVKRYGSMQVYDEMNEQEAENPGGMLERLSKIKGGIFNV